MNKLFLSLILTFLLTVSLHAVALETLGIRRVPITNMNFVFMESQGSLYDNFEKEKSVLAQYALKFGLTTYKSAIMFLDSYGPDIDDIKLNNGKPVPVTQEYLEKTYGIPFLETKRKVLVGVLVFPSQTIAVSDEFQVYKLQNVKPPMFQSLVVYGKNANNLDEPEYTKEDRVFDRTSMLRYMDETGQDNYIGMLEMEDSQNNTLTFMAIEGSKKDFISNYNIRPIGQ